MGHMEDIRTLEAALDAAIEEARNMATELGRHDRVTRAARALVEAWREGRLVEEHFTALEKELGNLAN